MVVSHVDDQPCTSNTAERNNQQYSFVVELPEDDPLYVKKKKLLQSKGFAPSERVYLNESPCHDRVNVTLETLLQQARIIQLNEIELYFGKVSVDPPLKFYSPRNELEALNFILSLIDISVKNSVSETKTFLQHLRDATLDRIQTFGEKHKVASRTLENACDKERRLMKWAVSSGVKSKLQISYVEGAGRGAVAMDDLGVGDTALEIPLSVIISEELGYESDMFQLLEKMDGISAETMLLLWSMRERHISDSKYRAYFDALPGKFNTGLSFGVKAIMALDGTLVLEEILQAKQHLQLRYDELFPALCDSYPDMFPPEYYTWEQYLWACELWYSNSMRIMFPDGKLRTCLIPVAGFLNHSICPHIMHYGKIDAMTNTLKFPLCRPCKAGEQCCLSYGNLPSSHLLTFYGFLPQGSNPYDVIPLDIGGAQEFLSEEMSLELESNEHMVRATWLSANQEIFYYGLPTPLLDHLRRLRSPSLHTMTLLQENLENEIAILEDIQAIFEGMMEELGDTDDRDNNSWDVKLAIEFKDTQRVIVSSVLVSCGDGRRMVVDELMKCMSEDMLG